ncbi:F-box/FBD/LRR-repeat protein At3g52680-like, partial [Fagus crenata]
ESESISGVDRWISCVVESDVEEMIFKFKRSDFIEYYSLPHSVFVAKSLTVLTLHMCKFESTCGDVTISSSSLKKLSSTNVYADDQIIQNLLDGCPAMEYISFASCFRIKSIKFIGLPKVMEIKTLSLLAFVVVDLGLALRGPSLLLRAVCLSSHASLWVSLPPRGGFSSSASDPMAPPLVVGGVVSSPPLAGFISARMCESTENFSFM